VFKRLLKLSTISFFILLIGAESSCKKAPKACEDFKIGKFKYKNTALSQWVVIRNDSLQIEQNMNTGAKVVSRINWQSECHYTLEFLGEKGFPSNHKSDESAIEIIDVEILEVSADGYKYQATGPKNSTISWMIKLSY